MDLLALLEEAIVEKITGDDELRRLRGAGRGFIYNDFSGNGPDGWQYNILHVASCRTLERANAKRKYHAADKHAATAWLRAN